MPTKYGKLSKKLKLGQKEFCISFIKLIHTNKKKSFGYLWTQCGPGDENMFVKKLNELLAWIFSEEATGKIPIENNLVKEKCLSN